MPFGVHLVAKNTLRRLFLEFGNEAKWKRHFGIKNSWIRATINAEKARIGNLKEGFLRIKLLVVKFDVLEWRIEDK